ncbi:hypothetical protein [Aliiroseovarius crassostreae]|uniref:hypothetical protein n=1 Tax=Aliiroseovarius crassostreae TaxID=154981 RepID=UPI003C7A0BDC
MANPPISRRKIIIALILFAVCFLAGYFGGEPLRVSEKPSEYIAVLFSILSASVFAVISIIGDPSMLLPGGRRVAWENAKSIQVELQKLNHVFYIHIGIIFLLIISELVEEMCWVEYYFVFNFLAFLSTLGFILTLSLPHKLSKIQRERLTKEIESRKN